MNNPNVFLLIWSFAFLAAALLLVTLKAAGVIQ